MLEGEDLLGGIKKKYKKKPGEVDALDPAVLKNMLPSEEAEYKKAEFLKDMFTTSSRAGAGGTKVGLPGLRPSGGEKVKKFHDEYTGTGRYKEPDRPFSKGLIEPPRPKLDSTVGTVRIYIPQNVCFACMRTDRPVGTKEKPSGMINGYPYFNDRADLGIKKGEFILSTICQQCVEKHNAKLSRQVLEVSKDAIVKEWMVRIFVNRENYIRACRTSQGDDHSIYVKEEMSRLWTPSK